ncbi:two-component system connector SafA [Escherichia coli]
MRTIKLIRLLISSAVIRTAEKKCKIIIYVYCVFLLLTIALIAICSAIDQLSI